jgi:hypothetical protein
MRVADSSSSKHAAKGLLYLISSRLRLRTGPPCTLGPIEIARRCAGEGQRVTTSSAAAMSRLVGQAPLQAAARAFTPSRLAPPRISAHRIGRSFLSSTSARRFTPSLQRLDKYTPERIPNAEWPYLYSKFNKMANLDSYFQQVDFLQDKFIDRLREAVAIPSISSEDQRRPDVVKVQLAPQLWRA